MQILQDPLIELKEPEGVALCRQVAGGGEMLDDYF